MPLTQNEIVGTVRKLFSGSGITVARKMNKKKDGYAHFLLWKKLAEGKILNYHWSIHIASLNALPDSPDWLAEHVTKLKEKFAAKENEG